MEWFNENSFDAAVYGVLAILLLWTVIKYQFPILCPACEEGSTKLLVFRCYPPTGPGSRFCKTAKFMETLQDGKFYIMIGDKIEQKFNDLASELPGIMDKLTTQLYTSVLKLVDRVSAEFAKLQKQVLDNVSAIIAEAIQIGQNLWTSLYDRIVQPMVDFILANMVQPIQQLLVEINKLRIEVIRVVTDALVQAKKYTIDQIDNALRTIDQGLLAIPEGLSDVIDQLTTHVNEISRTLTGELSKTINEANRATAQIVTNGIRQGEEAINQSLAGAEAAINSVIKDGVENPINSLIGDFDEVISTISTLTGRFDTLANTVATLTGQVDDVTGKVTSLVGQVGDVVGKVTSLTGQIGDVTGKVTNLTAQFDSVTGELTSLTGRIGNVTGEIDALTGKVGDVTGQVTSLRQSFDGVNGTMTNLSSQFSDVNGKITTLTNQFNDATGKITNLVGRVDDASGKITSLTNTVNNIVARVDDATGKITSLTGQIGGVTGEVTNLTGKIGDVTGKVTNLTAKIDGVTGELTSLTGRIGSVTGEVSALSGQIGDVTGKITNLTRQVDSVVTGFDNVYKTVDKVVGFTDNIVDGWNKIRDLKLSQSIHFNMPKPIPDMDKTINFGSPFSFLPKLNSLKSDGSLGPMPGTVRITATSVFDRKVCKVGIDGKEYCMDATQFAGSPPQPQFCSADDPSVCVTQEEYAQAVRDADKDTYKSLVSSYIVRGEKCTEVLGGQKVCVPNPAEDKVCYDSGLAKPICVKTSYYTDNPSNNKYCETTTGLLGSQTEVCMSRNMYNQAVYYDNIKQYPLGAARRRRPSPVGATAKISVPDVKIPRVIFPEMAEGLFPEVTIGAPELPKVDLGPVRNLGGFSLRDTVWKAGDDVWNQMMKYYEEAMRPIVQSIQTITTMVMSIFESVKLFAAQYINIDHIVSALGSVGPKFTRVKRKDLKDAVYYIMASGPLGATVSIPSRLTQLVNDLASSIFLPIINMIYEQTVVPIYNFTADVWDIMVAEFNAEVKPILVSGLYQVSLVMLEGLKFTGEVILDVAQEVAQSSVHIGLYWFQRAADWFLFFIPSATLRVNLLALLFLAFLVFVVFGPHTHLFWSWYFSIPPEVRNILWLVFAVYWLYLLVAH